MTIFKIVSPHQRTTLHLAAQEGRFERVKDLVERGADVNVRDVDGVSDYIGLYY